MVEKQVRGFMLFVREQGVVGLAVGLVLGTAIKSVVDSLVLNIINPLIGILTGGVDLTDKVLCLSRGGNQCAVAIGYGSFISTLISFLTIAAIVYFGVKGLKLDKLDIDKDMKKGIDNGAPGIKTKAAKKKSKK